MSVTGVTKDAAERLLHDSFPDAQALESAQSEGCKLSILIPAYGEQPQDVIKQLGWLLEQSVDPANLEVIYAVNNAPPKASPEWQVAFDRNQAVLGLPIFRNARAETHAPTGFENDCRDIREELAVFALDLSSPGSWVEGCNVGLVRQRLLGEAVLRFAKQDQNGLLMYSDVDTYIEEPETLQRVFDAFETDSKLLAIPGAMTQEADLNCPEGVDIAANLERVKLAAVWFALQRAWQQEYAVFDPMRFYGPCMIMRAYEAADMGGFSIADEVATDVKFGEKLVAYARSHDQHVVHGRELGIGVINALRWSGRTRNNTLHEGFRLATTPGPMQVENPLENEVKTQELTPELLGQLAAAVRQLPGGTEYVDHMLHRSFIVRARQAPHVSASEEAMIA